MSKHTPGPWIAPEDQANLIAPKVSYESNYVGELKNSFQAFVYGCEGEEMRANARLIAAAPELLAALEFARDHFISFGYGDHPLMRSAAEAVDDEIRAAIAKAKGGA